MTQNVFWPDERHVSVPAAGNDGRLFTWITSVVVVTGLLALLFSGDDMRAVLGPIVVMVDVTFFYLAVLTRREGHLPLFEAATYFVLATAIYTIVPLVQFIFSGMECLNNGDYRLWVRFPTPQEFGGFAWRHVLLQTTFVATYLLVRGKRLWKQHGFARPQPIMLLVIVTLVVLLNGYFFAIDAYLGPTTSVYEGGTGLEITQLPLLVQQITNVLQIMRITLKQCLIIVLLAYWPKLRWRMVLLTWLAVEVLLTVRALESRTGTVLLLLTFLVGYHLIVKPIRVGKAFLAGMVLLGGFLIFGVLRDVGIEGVKMDRRYAWGSATEFMVLYGNAYDIHIRKNEGVLPPVPRQLFFSDLYRLVPSQLLPFFKWEPSVWYRNEVLEMRDSGMGYMFGIVAQSVLGYDWMELFLRGFLLALFYAAAHRAWRRYSGSFWATIAYVFILTWAYYAFRSSSFEIFYRLVYYLAPSILVVKILTVILSGPHRTRPRLAATSR